MHETRRLCGSGHQTSIVTTLLDLLLVDLLSRMFARWCQENFFCYMIHEQVLDFLCAYTVALADPERSGPPPAAQEIQKQRASLQRELTKLRKAKASALLGQSAKVCVKYKPAVLRTSSQDVEPRIEEHKVRLKTMFEIPAGLIPDGEGKEFLVHFQ